VIPPFPAQFLILLGIDIFLGSSIVVVLFDEEFPNGLPYILDFGALVGFVQLVMVPGYLESYPTEMQFYYSAAFATVAVLSVIACCLYVTFRHRLLVAGTIAIAAAIPSVLSLLYFASAWLNGTQVPLPTFPRFPWPVVWAAFILASAIILVAMAVVVRGNRNKASNSP
jgi:hypothetical protein